MKRRHSFLVEAMIGVAFLMFLNVMLFDKNLGYTKTLVNPYWIVVIFVAMRYGSIQGMVAGLLSSAAFLASVGYASALSTGFKSFTVSYEQIQLSGLFILVGFLLGEERRRVNKVIERQKSSFDKLREEFEGLAMDTLALKNINTELEGRVLSQGDTVSTLYEAARSLASLRNETLYPSVINLITKIIKPDKCSLYIWEDGKYVLKAHSGWGGDIKSRQALDGETDIVRLCREQKRLVTVKDVFKTASMKWTEKKDPPMIAPLFFGEQKDMPAGFVVIDDIPFLKMNPDSIRFLGIMADWISRSFENICEISTVRLEDVYDKDLKIYNYDYALRRLREEFVNLQVCGKQSSIMLVKVNDLESIDQGMRRDIMRAVGFVLKNSLRASDTVASYATDDTFMVILPGTDSQGIKIVATRMKQQIEGYDFKPYSDQKKKLNVNIAVNVISPEHKSERELLKDAEKTLV